MFKKSMLSTALTSLIMAANCAPAFAGNDHTNSSSLIPTFLKDVPTQANAGSTDVVINHKTNRVYIPNLASGSVSVVDGKTDTLIANIAIDSSQGASGAYLSGPAGIAIDEEKNLVFVATNNGTLSVVDGKTNQVKSSFVFDTDNTGPEGFSTGNVVYSKKTGKLYVTNADIQIDVIDPIAQKVITRIPDDTAYTLAIDQEKNLIYVNNLWDGAIAVIDGDTDQFTSTLIQVGRAATPTDCYKNFPVNPNACTDEGSHADGIALDEELHRLYVGLEGDGVTALVDTKHNKLLENLPVYAYRTAINTETHAAYFIDETGPNLYVFDGFTDTQVGNPIAVATGLAALPNPANIPSGVAVNSQTGKVYVADFGDFLGGADQLVVLKLKHHDDD